MTKRMNKKLIFGAALVGVLSLSGATVLMAGPVTVPITATLQNSTTENVTSEMAWGDIDVNPTGTTTCTLDASGGAVTAMTCDNGTVSGGTVTSGQITVESPISFTIGIAYPADSAVTISDGTSDLEVDAIAANSTATGIAHTGGTPTLINVGATLNIIGGTDLMADYIGDMTVTLSYN